MSPATCGPRPGSRPLRVRLPDVGPAAQAGRGVMVASSRRIGAARKPDDGAVHAERTAPTGTPGSWRCPAAGHRPRRRRTARRSPRGQDERPSDQPEQRHARRHQLRPVHQVAQDEPVPDADDEARPEQERPVLAAQRTCRRSRLRSPPASSCCKVTTESTARMPTRMKVHSTIASRHVAERERLVLPLQQRIGTSAVPMFAMIRISSSNHAQEDAVVVRPRRPRSRRVVQDRLERDRAPGSR